MPSVPESVVTGVRHLADAVVHHSGQSATIANGSSVPVSHDAVGVVDPLGGLEQPSVNVPEVPNMPKKAKTRQSAGAPAQAVRAAAAVVQKAAKVERRIRRDERALKTNELHAGAGIRQWALPSQMGRSSVRREMMDRDGNAVIFGSDFVASAVTTSINNVPGGVLYNFFLNPTQDITLSLQQFSLLYQRFEFLEVAWIFETGMDTFKSGSVGVLMDADATDFDGVGQVLLRQTATTRQGYSTPVRKSCSWIWQAAKDAPGVYYCSMDPSSNSGIRQTIQSHFVAHVVVPVAASDGTLYNGTLGSFRVVYKIRFFHRQIEPFFGGSPFASLSFAKDAEVFGGVASQSTYWPNYVSSYSVGHSAKTDTLQLNMRPGAYLISLSLGCMIALNANLSNAILSLQSVTGSNTVIFGFADVNDLTFAAAPRAALPDLSGQWDNNSGGTGMAMSVCIVCHEPCNVLLGLVSNAGYSVTTPLDVPNAIVAIAPTQVEGVPVFKPSVSLARRSGSEDARIARLEALVAKLGGVKEDLVAAATGKKESKRDLSVVTDDPPSRAATAAPDVADSARILAAAVLASASRSNKVGIG